MLLKKHLCFLLVLSLCGQTAWSQHGLSIKGRVMEQDANIPVAYVSIAIVRNDSIVDGTVSNEEGHFALTTVDDFQVLHVNFIGYEPKVVLRESIDPHKRIEIFLALRQEVLDEVVVAAERTATQQLIDRKVINVGADLQQTGISALEVFDQIAEIQTDLGTGQISLRGNSNVLILINGKPSGFSPSELLAQIPSSAIDKIEIITSPSAKYQADGISGIINIQLKRNRKSGLNLNLNAGIGTKRYNYALDGNYRYKKLNLRWNYAHSKRDMDSKQWLERAYSSGRLENIYAPHDFDGNVSKLSLGLDLLLNKRNECSVSWDYTDDNHDFFNNILYTYPTGEDSVAYLRTSSHFHYTNTWNANYRFNVNDKGHFWELEYNLNRNNNDFPAADSENDVFLFEERYANQNSLQTLSLDYSLPISKRATVEAGANWNKRNLHSQYAFTEANGSDESTASYDYGENVWALYGVFRHTVEEKYTLQAGLRYEYFASQGQTPANLLKVNYDFSDFFPSLHISYSINEYQTWNVGISRRISRPHFNHINPHRIGNPYFNFVGNPELLPEYSNNMELTYNLSNEDISLAATTFYRHRTNIILWVDSFTDEGVQQVKNINAGDVSSYGMEANVGKNLFPFMRSSLAANLYFHKLHDADLATWNKLYSSSLQLRNTFRIGKACSMDISYRYTPKQQGAFEYIDPRNRLDLAVRAKLFKKRLAVNLSIVDVLNVNLFHRHVRTSTLNQDTLWRFQSQTRGYVLNVSYVLVKNNEVVRNRKKRNYHHGGATD